jgi:hypothetical protein
VNRSVQPEILDGLPADDPEAKQSRRDLERLNGIMGNSDLLAKGIASLPEPPEKIVEIGAGNGTLLLKALRTLPRPEQESQVTFLDLVDLITPGVKEEYASLGWAVTVKTGDVRDTLDEKADLVLANLFLHHFTDPDLAELLSLIRNHTKHFFCVEPRRSRIALLAASLVRLVGCNHVTRHDAVVSVRAGFRDDDLSTLWDQEENWDLQEEPSPPFSHFFLATEKP